MRRVRVCPANRLRVIVVPSDVASDLPREIRQRRKDAAREQVAFDFAKPELHLIEPRRVGRREMQMNTGILSQKRVHPLRLVRRKVVDDHMNVPTRRLRREHVTQEVHECLAGMTWHRVADDFAGLRVQRGVQRQRAVAVVLESMAFRASGRR